MNLFSLKVFLQDFACWQQMPPFVPLWTMRRQSYFIGVHPCSDAKGRLPQQNKT